MLVLDVAAVGISLLLSRQSWSICLCVFVLIYVCLPISIYDFFLSISSVPLLDTPGCFSVSFLPGEFSESGGNLVQHVYVFHFMQVSLLTSLSCWPFDTCAGLSLLTSDPRFPPSPRPVAQFLLPPHINK